jgi:hypothetical protein
MRPGCEGAVQSHVQLLISKIAKTRLVDSTLTCGGSKNEQNLPTRF